MTTENSSVDLSEAGALGQGARLALYARYVAMAGNSVDRLKREIDVACFEKGLRRQLPQAEPPRVHATMTTVRRPVVFELPDSGWNFKAHARRSPSMLRRLGACWGVSFRSDINSDRLGLFWWLVEPLIHVLLVTAAALLIHGREVYGMPAFPFAVTGVMFWLTFRSSFVIVQAGPGRLVLLLEQPMINRFELMIVASVKALLVNFLVGMVLLSGCIFFELTTFPKNPILFLTSLIGTWVLGASLGLPAYHAAHFYPGLRKIYVMVLRVLAWISGIFFVSEQAQAYLSGIVLWNPILHLSQFGRSGWFDTYDSVDTSALFVIFTIIGTSTIGLACAVMNRRLRARVGEIA